MLYCSIRGPTPVPYQYSSPKSAQQPRSAWSQTVRHSKSNRSKLVVLSPFSWTLNVVFEGFEMGQTPVFLLFVTNMMKQYSDTHTQDILKLNNLPFDPISSHKVKYCNYYYPTIYSVLWSPHLPIWFEWNWWFGFMEAYKGPCLVLWKHIRVKYITIIVSHYDRMIYVEV